MPLEEYDSDEVEIVGESESELELNLSPRSIQFISSVKLEQELSSDSWENIDEVFNANEQYKRQRRINY